MVWKHNGNSQQTKYTHLLKCSVTQQFFVLHHKDVVLSMMQYSTTTKMYLSRVQEEIIKKTAEE